MELRMSMGNAPRHEEAEAVECTAKDGEKVAFWVEQQTAQNQPEPEPVTWLQEPQRPP